MHARAGSKLRADDDGPMRHHGRPVPLEPEREFCASVLPRVSRTFALSIAALPESLRETVGVAYLLCRIVDTIEDDRDLAADVRERLFDRFEELTSHDRAEDFDLAIASGSAADRELCAQAGAVYRVFRALPSAHRDLCRPHILEMARGMREYRRRGDRLRLRDLADLERYCYFVAGTVGELLTGLFEVTVPSMAPEARAEARARAVSFGLGLQLVNIVKDVLDDLERGDCFLPLDLLAANGIAVEDLRAPEHRTASLAVVRAVCARAREHLDRAREYTLLWPAPDVRFFCAVPLALALATLHEVETGRATKVSRETVARIFQEAQSAVADDEELAALLGAARVPTARA